MLVEKKQVSPVVVNEYVVTFTQQEVDELMSSYPDATNTRAVSSTVNRLLKALRD